MISIPVGPATSIIQNIVYALPGKATFLTSNDVVETSLDQLTWTAQAESVTGMITGSKFVRCTTTDSIIVCSNIVIESGTSNSNPFNQDLNTTDSPTFAGLTLNGDIILPSGSVLNGQGIIGGDGVDLLFQSINSGNPSGSALGLFDVGAVTLESNGTVLNTLTLNDGGMALLLNSNVFSFNIDGSSSFPGPITATDFIATTNPGIDTSITTGGLVGKTITVVNGRITAFA